MDRRTVASTDEVIRALQRERAREKREEEARRNRIPSWCVGCVFGRNNGTVFSCMLPRCQRDEIDALLHRGQQSDDKG